MKTGDIWLLEGGKLVEGASETQAAWGHYNFNNKTGEMKKLTGKNGKDFFAAPHAEIYLIRWFLMREVLRAVVRQ